MKNFDYWDKYNLLEIKFNPYSNFININISRFYLLTNIKESYTFHSNLN